MTAYLKLSYLDGEIVIIAVSDSKVKQLRKKLTKELGELFTVNVTALFDFVPNIDVPYLQSIEGIGFSIKRVGDDEFLNSQV